MRCKCSKKINEDAKMQKCKNANLRRRKTLFDYCNAKCFGMKHEVSRYEDRLSANKFSCEIYMVQAQEPSDL